MPGHGCVKRLRTGRVMPGNNERDPLDEWLDQQVRPLPPPPGTFEMIGRRARRRKARKLALAIASAAAVAAGVAIAVPNVTALHLRTAGESGSPVAASGANPTVGASQRPGGTRGLNRSRATTTTRLPVSTASPSVPGTAGGPAEGPVPASFEPTSVTFVSSTHAWVIGQAGTPGKCYNGSVCTSVAWTANDGATWHGEPAPVAGAPNGPDGVGGIRFLDGVNGWAFGPQLWVTHDSGNTWQQIGTNGLRVTDLEADGNRAYALFAKCSGASAHGFAADCTSYTLMTSLATGDAWTPVGPDTTNLAASPASSAMLALAGATGYLAAPDGTLYSGQVGGRWTKAGALPCRPGSPAANGLPATGTIAPSSAADLATACDGGTSGTSQAAIYTSTDGGATWTKEPAHDWSGLRVSGASVTSLTAAVDGTLVLSTASGIYVRPTGSSRWQAATAANSTAGFPAGGFSYVGMTTATRGVALPVNTSLHEIWLTTDGGLTWAASPITG